MVPERLLENVIVMAVDGAKGEDTRRRRIAKAVEDLRDGRA